ncbi:MAG: hydrogen peroxide-dependent heme synthase [Isosphaeraceae bacterium]
MSDQPKPTARLDAGHPRPTVDPDPESSLVPATGWHFLHLYYRIDRAALDSIDPRGREKGRQELVAALVKPTGVEQLQAFAVPGHKADFGVVLAGPDLKAVHGVQVAIQSGALGPALTLASSFYSITEVSEYVPDAEEYGRILREREGLDPETPSYRTKVEQYARRLAPMNKHRLYPEFPDWPCLCFYPMSKLRQGDQNWYLLPFEKRSELMAQHGRSGMAYSGKVSQVITASTGLDDWEWGVTLWARNPLFLKDIVYTMRFDESSAKYAAFGPFFFGYILPPGELIGALRL